MTVQRKLELIAGFARHPVATRRIIWSMSYPGPNAPMHSTQSTPSEWQLPSSPSPSRGPQGTPLGRIVAGVFLGLLAWTVVMGVIGFILLSVVSSQVEDAFNDAGITDTSTSTNDTGLSDECKARIDAGHSAGESVECSGDDTALILEYQATK